MDTTMTKTMRASIWLELVEWHVQVCIMQDGE